MNTASSAVTQTAPLRRRSVRRASAAAPCHASAVVPTYAGWRRCGAVDVLGGARGSGARASLAAAVATSTRRCTSSGFVRATTTAMFEVRQCVAAPTRGAAQAACTGLCVGRPFAEGSPKQRAARGEARTRDSITTRLRHTCRTHAGRTHTCPDACFTNPCVRCFPSAAVHGEGDQGGHARAGGGAASGPQLRGH